MKKGQKHSKEAKEKNRIAHLGRKHSKEAREKMGLANLGKKFSKEWCKKISLGSMGEKGNNWKGGITSEINCIVNHAEYSRFREKILERDGYICQVCRRNKSRLEVHHILEKEEYPELIMDVNNCITLCCKHHNEIHKFYRYLELEKFAGEYSQL